MKSFTLETADGLVLSGSVFEAENASAVVQIVHAFKGHKERYYRLAEFLLSKGYTTVITDLRGHGESVNAKYFAGHVGSAQELLNDQVLVTGYINENYPGKDVYLLGDSQGSMIARLYLKDHDKLIKKAVLTGAWAPSRLSRIRRSYCAFSASLHKDITANGHLAARANRPSENYLFTNYTAVSEYVNDPLVQNCMLTNGTIYAAADASFLATQAPIHTCENPDLRILIACGALDKCGAPKQMQRTVNYLKRDGYRHVFSVSYPEMKHCVLEEMYAEEVYEDIAAFLSD